MWLLFWIAQARFQVAQWVCQVVPVFWMGLELSRWSVLSITSYMCHRESWLLLRSRCFESIG